MSERRLTDAQYAELAADYAANPPTADEVLSIEINLAVLRGGSPSRVVLVHNGERVFDATGVSIVVAQQDGGATIKVIVTDLPSDEKARASADHRERLAQSLRSISAEYAEMAADHAATPPTADEVISMAVELEDLGDRISVHERSGITVSAEDLDAELGP